MKTIVFSAVVGALVAVTSLVSGPAAAADNSAGNVFEQQVRYGENTAGPTTKKSTLEIFGIQSGE